MFEVWQTEGNKKGKKPKTGKPRPTVGRDFKSRSNPTRWPAAFLSPTRR